MDKPKADDLLNQVYDEAGEMAINDLDSTDATQLPGYYNCVLGVIEDWDNSPMRGDEELDPVTQKKMFKLLLKHVQKAREDSIKEWDRLVKDLEKLASP